MSADQMDRLVTRSGSCRLGGIDAPTIVALRAQRQIEDERMEIKEVTKPSPEVLHGLHRLIPQLSRASPVDEAFTARGVGQALSRAAVARARAWGARTIDLTSRPFRGPAHRLYTRLGFVPRDTQVYRYTLEPSETNQ